MGRIRRLLAVFLALSLCICTLPGPVRAEESPCSEPTAETIPTEVPETTTEAESFPEETGETEATTAPEEPAQHVAAVTFSPAGGQIDTSDPVWITLSCATEGAAIFYALSTDGVNFGEFYPYTEPIPLSPGFGTLYIKARADKERYISDRQTVTYYTELPTSGWDLYFGSLHSHSSISDGTATVEELFYAASQAENMEFFAVTDHSNAFDNAQSGSLSADGTAISAQWAAGKSAAEKATTGTFVGIYGYEMAWPSAMGLGHISTFATAGFQSWQQSGFNTYDTGLQNYYQTLTTVPESISQWNHPGTFYGNFRDFGFYSPDYDKQITLMEVASGGELETAYASYIRALDLGWHLAPTNNQNTHSTAIGRGRTVVYAESLTEADIYEALRNYRCYATEDSDLSVFYCLDGYFMGTLLERRDVAETVTLTAKLNDPTDAIGTVEVLTTGAEVLATETVDASSHNLTFTLPSDYPYYLLRITQPDGDIAITAPVWIDGTEDVGISAFVSDTAVPVQGEPIHLSLSLFNEEKEDLIVEQVVISIGNEQVHSFTMGTVPSGQTKRCAFSLTREALGQTRITATVTALLGGLPRTYQQTLTLYVKIPEMLTKILVDGTHGSAPSLKNFRALAEENNIRLSTVTDEFTLKKLSSCGMVIIPAPEVAFEEDFLTKMAWFASCGGRILICGRADNADGAIHAAAELNRLLEAMGATMRICDDTATDNENNGGEATALFLSQYNGSWCENVTADQVYRMVDGCTVDPGSGTWLVKGHDTTTSTDGDGDGLPGEGNVILACEGKIFAAGSLFLSDADLAGPANIWDTPYANRTIVKALLGDTRQELPVSSLAEVRAGEVGEVFRIRGYVTAGTAKPHTTFHNTIYIQDDTGGIAISPFAEEAIILGTPVDIVGTLTEEKGNLVLSPMDFTILDAPLHRYEPLEGLWDKILVPETHGGQLLQVQGEVVQVIYTGETLCELLLKDKNGNQAIVHIEDYIRAGSTGENTLHQQIRMGQKVRCYGILHIREDGQTVLRVRNCEEVVYVPPVQYVWKPARDDNPRVGDSIGLSIAACILSGRLLWKKRRKK